MSEKKELTKEELEKVEGGAIYGSRGGNTGRAIYNNGNISGNGGAIYNDTAGIGGGQGKDKTDNPDNK